MNFILNKIINNVIASQTVYENPKLKKDTIIRLNECQSKENGKFWAIDMIEGNDQTSFSCFTIEDEAKGHYMYLQKLKLGVILQYF